MTNRTKFSEAVVRLENTPEFKEVIEYLRMQARMLTAVAVDDPDSDKEEIGAARYARRLVREIESSRKYIVDRSDAVYK